MEEEKAFLLLQVEISKARKEIIEVTNAFKDIWQNDPGTGVRAVMGAWNLLATRHLLAMITLSEERDLSMVADVHLRQMYEIWLQVRYFVSFPKNEREKLAEKISAWGCIEWLKKMERFKEQEFAKNGYEEVAEQLKLYDPIVISVIRKELSQHNRYWFGKTISELAKKVTRENEELQIAYSLISAEMHGSWLITLGVANPKPGSLDFRGYPDKAALFSWAADLLDQASKIYTNIWNEIANEVGAPNISV